MASPIGLNLSETQIRLDPSRLRISGFWRLLEKWNGRATGGNSKERASELGYPPPAQEGWPAVLTTQLNSSYTIQKKKWALELLLSCLTHGNLDGSQACEVLSRRSRSSVLFVFVKMLAQSRSNFILWWYLLIFLERLVGAAHPSWGLKLFPLLRIVWSFYPRSLFDHSDCPHFLHVDLSDPLSDSNHGTSGGTLRITELMSMNSGQNIAARGF